MCGAVVVVPALNCPLPEHDPLRAFLGMRFCETCFLGLKLEHLLNDQFREVVRGTLATRGLVAPDFDRAWLERVELDSPEMKALDSKARMTEKEFNGLLRGPLHHPMPMFVITRLMLALRYVVDSTGPAGAAALRAHCKERQAKDARDAE